jgi:protein TonB
VLLVAPALDLRSSRSAPEEPLVQIELVETPRVPETSVPVLPKPVPVAQPPVPLPPQPATPVEPVTTVKEAPPAPAPPKPVAVVEPVTAVVEAPKAPAPVAQPARVEAKPSPPAEPEPVVVASHLSVNTAPAPLHRPLNAVAVGPKRALRDPAAEFGAIRTKARMGDNPKPVYPRSARESGWEGTVVLKVDVLENGMAGAVMVHKSCGHEVLDSAALSAAQQWKFAPAMDGAFPVRSVVYLPVQFDLRSAR